MANGLLEKKNLEDIAAAIRVKNGKTTKYKASQMADAIMELKLGGSVIVSNEVSEVHIIDGKTTINVPKTEKEPEVGDFIIAQTKNGNDYDAAVFKIDAVDKDTDADNYICNVTVSDTLDVIGVDSSNATALSTDIMKGKTAYVNNEKVTGTLEALSTKELTKSTVTAGKATETDTENNLLEVSLTNDLANDKIINNTTTLSTKVLFSDVTTSLNIKSSDIVTGKTVLGIAGTGGASGGVDTSDANAVATNIESGKTAYVNGVKVTGTLAVLTGSTTSDTCTSEVTADKSGIEVKLGKTDKSILDANATLKSTISFTDLNTALTTGGAGVDASDIAQGKTVLGITGTFTSDADAVAGNIEKDKTAYVNGAKVTGTLETLTTPVSASTVSYNTTDGEVELSTSITGNRIVKDSVSMKVAQSDIVAELGLTADKIAKGTTILGVEGTFEATADKEKQITDLTNEVARLQAIIDGYEDLNNVEF